MGHIAYSPASLRPGGALHVFAQGNASLADLMYRGRWDCAKTLSHYLQEGFAALATVLVPPTSAQVIRGLAELLPDLVEELALQKGLGGRAHLPFDAAAVAAASGRCDPCRTFV